MSDAALIVTVLALLLIVVAVVWRRSHHRAIVIGTHMALAQAREQQHREAVGNLPSPLSALGYNQFEPEQNGLLDIKVTPVDVQLSRSVDEYLRDSNTDQAQFRSAATIDDFYTLLHFAKRASVFALHGNGPEWLERAIAAVAAVDGTRIDPRDIPMTLCLINHAAERLNLDPARVFSSGAQNAVNGTQTAIAAFQKQSPQYKDIRASWGFEEISGPNGSGFVSRGFESYAPTRDLVAGAREISGILQTQAYATEIEVATELPDVWFSPANREAAAHVLGRARATVSIRGSLRSDLHPRADAQMLLVFLVQTASDADAKALASLARGDYSPEIALSSQYVSDLFLRIIGRAFEQGVAAYETTATLSRFDESFGRVLAQLAGG